MKKVLGNIFMAIIYFILYLPLIVMLIFSFNAGRSTSVFKGFSFKWYAELFTNSADIGVPVRNTLFLAVLSAAVATVIGTAAAVYIYYVRNKAWKSALNTVTNIPMMNPDIVTGVSLMLLFVFVGRLVGALNSLNFFTLLIAHITFNIPFVMLGTLIIVLYYRNRMRTERFRLVWLWILLSFLFYIPVAVFAGVVPMLGMLMLPKTVCYMIIIFTFYGAVTKDRAAR